MKLWDYLEGVLKLYGSVRGRERFLVGGRASSIPSLDALLADCRMTDLDWTRLLEDEAEEAHSGPTVSDHVVFITSAREAFPNWKALLKRRPASDEVADRPFVVGGDAAIDAIIDAHPDLHTSKQHQRWDELLLDTFEKFLLVGTHRPAIRVPPDSASHIQQRLDLAGTARFFEKRGVRVLRLKDVGVIRDAGGSVRFAKPRNVPIAR